MVQIKMLTKVLSVYKHFHTTITNCYTTNRVTVLQLCGINQNGLQVPAGDAT
jgi:hypothetical protein